MVRVVLSALAVLLLVTIPAMTAQDADTPAEADGPETFTIRKGTVSPDVGWTFTVVVNASGGSDHLMFRRSAAGTMRLGPGFYEVYKINIGDEGISQYGDLSLDFIASSCGRRNQIVDDFFLPRDELILHCAATLAWRLDTNWRTSAIVLVQVEDWSEA